MVKSKTSGKACDSLLHLSVIFVVRKARGIAYNSFWVYEPEAGAYNGCSPRFLPTMLRSCCIYLRIPLEQEAVRPATAPPRMNSSALVGSSLFELRLSLGSVSYTHLTLPTTPYV